jgi:hypothetical protein
MVIWVVGGAIGVWAWRWLWLRARRADRDRMVGAAVRNMQDVRKYLGDD